MTTLPSDINNVLNVDTNKIVSIPLSNPLVMRQNALYQLDTFDVLAIDNASYKDIAGFLSLNENEEDTNKPFFINLCKTLQIDGLKLSDTGLGYVYEVIRAYSGDSMTGILDTLAKDDRVWGEVSLDDALLEYSINPHDMSEDEKLAAVVKSINESEDRSYHASYEQNGTTTILHSQVTDKL